MTKSICHVVRHVKSVFAPTHFECCMTGLLEFYVLRCYRIEIFFLNKNKNKKSCKGQVAKYGFKREGKK